MRDAVKDSAGAWSWRIVILLMLTALPQAGAVARSGTMRFDLPAQSLEKSLAAFGRLTGHSVLVTSDLIADRQAAEVHDDLPPREALQRMLAGTQLEARYTSATAFTLVSVRQRLDTEAPVRNDKPVVARRSVDTDYAAVIQNSITRVMCEAQPETFGRFRIGIQLWVAASGRVSEARVLEASGIPERDAEVLEQMRNMTLDAPPPASMPQPVTILLTPRPDPMFDCLSAGAGHD